VTPAVRVDSFRACQLCFVLSGVLTCALGTAAQTLTAVLEAIVQDSSGGVIVNAAVEVRDVQTNQRRTGVTDVQGSVRFTELPVGTYEVSAVYDGFEPYVHAGVTLTIGQTARLVVVMRPAGVIQSVAVSAQPPLLDSRQTSVTATVDTERIEELPVRSRNYLEFVLLAPGVTRHERQAVPGVATSTLPDSGFSFGGLRPRSNSLTIDGLDNNDEFTGSTRTELSLEFVREFQVVTNGWPVENGGASGGAINVVTKSGANTLHGDAFLFGQFGRFNARPKLEETLGKKPSLTRYRGGLAVGGPVVTDRTFYYAAAEREQTDDETASDIDANAISAINTALSRGLLPQVHTRALTSGLFAIARTETEWAAKLTRQLDGRGAVVGRIAATHNHDTRNAFNTGGLSDRSIRGTDTTRDLAFTGSWTTVLSPRTTNELRGQLATRRSTLSSTETDGSSVSISGVADFGSAYVGNNTHDQAYVELGDTVTHSLGAHLLRTGINLRHVGVTGTTADGSHGIDVFRTLDAFLGARPDTTRRMSAGAALDFSVTRASAFVQDHWTLHPALTVDAGARFDASVFPSSFGITSRQLSPRVGVAWMPVATWVVRGGAGVFADRLVLAALERGWLAQQHQVVEVATDQSSAPSLYTVRPGTWRPSSRQASIGVERELTSNVTASINYLYVRGHALPRTVNVNLPPPMILTLANADSLGVDAPAPQQLGRPVFGHERLSPAWNGIFELQPTASSAYHGVTVALNRRFVRETEWSAAYTWSHARDSASDFDEQPQNPYAVGEEWADSRYDQRQRLVVSALFDLPVGEEEDGASGEAPDGWIRIFRHIEVAPILTVGSGRPANALTGGDDNRTGAFPFTSRPLNIARNSWRLPATATLDLRILKYFNIKPHGKLDVVVEAFNVFNRTNVTQVNTVYGPLLAPFRSFGRAIEAGSARQFQFSFDFEF
jgi:Carboxypeptidase regulatory-like domain/TonB dependent receptor-like, beta-barrel